MVELISVSDLLTLPGFNTTQDFNDWISTNNMLHIISLERNDTGLWCDI